MMGQVPPSPLVRVKLCGLMRWEDVVAAWQLGADYIGFVLAPSKRQVAAEDVGRWLAQASAVATVSTVDSETTTKRASASASKDQGMTEHTFPVPVLVLVDPTYEQVIAYRASSGVSSVQLCGNESPALCKRLREDGFTVWKAWGVRGNVEDAEVKNYAGTIDALLLDAFKGTLRGGTGAVFDWQHIAKFATYVPATPLIVAGGLTPQTVGTLLADCGFVQPYAVDVSSGIETMGSKDHAKMREFIANVRSVYDVSR